MQQFAVTFNDADSVRIDRVRNTRPNKITLRQCLAKSVINILRLLRRKKERRRRKKNIRCLIDYAGPVVRRSFTQRERRRYALLGSLPTANDKDPRGDTRRGRRGVPVMGRIDNATHYSNISVELRTHVRARAHATMKIGSPSSLIERPPGARGFRNAKRRK